MVARGRRPSKLLGCLINVTFYMVIRNFQYDHEVFIGGVSYFKMESMVARGRRPSKLLVVVV